MCGFTAMLALDGGGADPIVVDRMTTVIAHRGPDDEGRFFAGNVGLGFRRLAILDLSASGHQPMRSPDRRYAMVFNGEIYNYVELRRDLAARGHQFESTGDSEVLLHAFMEWGAACVDRLNGMWAFLIYDVQTGRLFGSRDRFGKKPLYYHRGRDCLLFASEIKAIVASGQYTPEPNWPRVSEFLLGGNFNELAQGDSTFYAGVLQVPSGTVFDVDAAGHFQLRRFWSLPASTAEQVEDPAGTFGEILEDAVRLRLRSDVPLAVFLSGGLDSSSVLCTAARLRNANPESATGHLVALSYHTDEFDETRYVDETIRQTGAELIRFQASPSALWGELKRFLWFQDEPVHTFAALIYYELCRIAASNGVKVILAGGGADEYLAGYFNYFGIYWQSLLRSGRFGRAWHEINSFSSTHGTPASALLRATLRPLATHGLKRLPGLRGVATRRRHASMTRNPWYSRDIRDNLPRQTVAPDAPDLSAALRDSVEQAPLPLYLREDDRSSMAHGVEARSPFLDHRLVSLTFRLPPEWKLRGPWNKYLLREAMRGRIPESVRTRPDKMGFSVPRHKWFSEVLYEPMQDLIASATFRQRGIYNVQQIRTSLDLHRRGRIDCADRLFNLLQLELWLEGLQPASIGGRA